MKLKRGGGNWQNPWIPYEMGNGETQLILEGIRLAIDAIERMFSDHVPDAVYRSSLMSVMRTREIVEEAAVVLPILEARLKKLERELSKI